MHNLLFYAQTLCINYVTNTFLLVSSSVQSKQLLCSDVNNSGNGERGTGNGSLRTSVQR